MEAMAVIDDLDGGPSDVLPTWDLTPLFPGVGSRELAAAHESVGAGLSRLTALYDQHDVRGAEPHAPSAEEVAALEEVLAATNELHEEMRPLTAYLYGLTNTDTRDEEAAGTLAALQADLAPLRTLSSRFAAWVATLGAENLIEASTVAADHAWPLRKAELTAAHQMTEAEEDLAAELNLTGGAAWNRLHGDVSGRLHGDMRRDDGTVERLPVTVLRNLAGAPEASVRRAAYEAELLAWEGAAVPLAAAMNGIKGEANALNRRRGWEDSLAPALHSNAVDRGTLEAMQAAVVASFPDFRRYLQAKAALLGHASARLPWWDLFAPVGDPELAEITWDEATSEVLQAFGSYSPMLSGLAERAFADRWVDAGSRDGKRGGAFCMQVRGGESRVMMNFAGTFDSVSTLAHELGHAYHNANLADRTPMQRQTPMALAETASIFCETILVQSGLAGAAPATRLALLDTDLTGATQVVVDIHSRFLFEREVCERRADRTLSATELCEQMTAAQLATYGDGLDEDVLHPYMWAVKPHYYSSAYYNWPYTFGLLFGIGLYARYTEDPERFRQGYDDLLSSTGLADAAELSSRFGIDVRDEAFWTSSLDVIRGRIAEYVTLAGDFDAAPPAR
jgi:pepF/M3 family oligoendopeptidase